MSISEQPPAFRPGWVPRGGSCVADGHALEQSRPKRCANTGSGPDPTTVQPVPVADVSSPTQTVTVKIRLRDKHAAGLRRQARAVNLTDRGVIQPGDRFGRLVAIAPGPPIGRRSWHVKCECGNEVVAEARKLSSGHKRSCGCLLRNGDHLKRITAAAASANLRPIIGERFGRLKVTSSAGRAKSGEEVLNCACDCGGSASIRRQSLTSGDTRSCGCLSSQVAADKADKIARRKRRAAGLHEDIPMSPVNKALRDKFSIVLAPIIRDRDNYTCAICDRRGVRLNVHHIKSWSSNRDLRFDPRNLITLCRECHVNKAHSGNVHREPNPEVAETLGEIAKLRCENWQCSECGTEHDRDHNAALTIARLGLETLAGGAPNAG